MSDNAAMKNVANGRKDNCNLLIRQINYKVKLNTSKKLWDICVLGLIFNSLTVHYIRLAPKVDHIFPYKILTLQGWLLPAENKVTCSKACVSYRNMNLRVLLLETLPAGTMSEVMESLSR